jgi:hypothetical protein
MDRLDNSFPRRGLSGIRDAGLEEVTLAGLVIDVKTFGDQQGEPTVGEDRVIGANPIGGNAFGCRAYSGHRRQGDAVGQVNLTDGCRPEKGFMPRTLLERHGVNHLRCRVVLGWNGSLAPCVGRHSK